MPKAKKETAAEVYLQKAVLEGYRTIRKLEVEFLPGLNIIIGKNGTGKTNLMEYLYRALNFSNNRNLLIAKLVIEKVTSKEPSLFIEHNSNFKTNDFADHKENILLDYKSNTDIAVGEEKWEGNNGLLPGFLREKGYLYNSSLIRHGIPSQYYFFNEPFGFVTTAEDKSRLLSRVFSLEFPLFIRIILAKFVFTNAEDKSKEAKIKEFIEGAFSILKKLKEPLKHFSIIEDIRLSDKFNIYPDSTKDAYAIQNLLFEFRVNNQWIPYSSLSDGTKRAVYIATEVLAEEGYYFIYDSLIWLSPSSSRIILLEEPELGLHPHQLSQLMEFLCEQAKHKQIIISTHSPIVLDSVDPAELDRIQIAELTPEGTQLRRLSPEQQEKARIYLEETGLLSDYWRFSDLEA